MKNIYLAIEERIGKIPTVILFIAIFIAIVLGVFQIDQVISYLQLFMN